jgi:hypothetical protein
MNRHIEEYLDYYLSLDKSPNYAVLLRGNWGIGKTWFIKNYIKKSSPESFLYISLNGVTSYKEIENSIFQQLHPLLSSKPMKFVGKFLKGAVKATLKVDLDGDNKEEGSLSTGIPEINIQEYFKNLNEKKLVFDDLERCSIELHNILGYINYFVETNGLKVIIVANEEEIIKFNEEAHKSKNNSKSYLRIKEKLIGKSFDIQSDIDSGIEIFVEEIRDEKVKNLLTEKGSLMKELFITTNYQNLRHLRQTIIDFERFYSYLPTKALAKDNLLSHIINLFFSIAFELKAGAISEEEIPLLFRMNSLFDNPQDGKKEIKSIQEKHTAFSSFDFPISGNQMQAFFKYGTLEKQELETTILSSIYFTDENTPDWIKLWYFYDLEDDEFTKLFKNVYDDFVKLRIEDKYVLLQVVGMFILFSKLNLIQNKTSTIISIAKRNVTNLINKSALNINVDPFPAQSSHGLVYRGLNLDEMDKFLEYVTSEVDKLAQKDYSKAGFELLKILEKSIDEFRCALNFDANAKSEYYNVPILANISVNMFVNSYLKLTNKSKNKLGEIFENRYSSYYIKALTSELPWLEELIDKIREEKEKRKRKISGEVVDTGFITSLNKSIKRLRNFSDTMES